MVRRFGRKLLATSLAIGIGGSIVGASFALSLFPWTNLVVLLVALSAGILLGRSLKPTPWPLLVLLLVFSVLDILQIALTSGGSAPGGSTGTSLLQYSNLTIPPPIGRFNLGILDILFIATIAEHWRRRGGSVLLAEGPGVIGFIAAGVFVVLTPYSNLPLIPFLTFGWLISQGASRVNRRTTKSGERS